MLLSFPIAMRFAALAAALLVLAACGGGGSSSGPASGSGVTTSAHPTTSGTTGSSGTGGTSGGQSTGTPGSGASSGSLTSSGATGSTSGSTSGGVVGPVYTPCTSPFEYVDGNCLAGDCTGLPYLTPCELDGGVGTCAAGACQELDLETDPNNCGGVGIACPTGDHCEFGYCYTPADGFVVCLSSVCPAGHVCVQDVGCLYDTCTGAPDDSVCQGATAQEVCCGGACVSVSTDAANCGGCGRACPSGSVCQAGACAVASCLLDAGVGAPCALDGGAGQCCGGTCVDTLSSLTSCGACGSICPTMVSEGCYGGTCFPECQAQTDCPGRVCIRGACLSATCGAGSQQSACALSRDHRAPHRGQLLWHRLHRPPEQSRQLRPVRALLRRRRLPRGPLRGLSSRHRLHPGEHRSGLLGAWRRGLLGHAGDLLWRCVHVLRQRQLRRVWARLSDDGWLCQSQLRSPVPAGQWGCHGVQHRSLPDRNGVRGHRHLVHPGHLHLGDRRRGLRRWRLPGESVAAAPAWTRPRIAELRQLRPVVPVRRGLHQRLLRGRLCCERLRGRRGLHRAGRVPADRLRPGRQRARVRLRVPIGSAAPLLGTCCNGNCVDPAQSPQNCGGCGFDCADGGTCLGGACYGAHPLGDCLESCAPGTYCSGSTCLPATCEAAGQVCPAEDGPPGICCETSMGLSCADLMNDPSNCGGCAVRCPSGQTCALGVCSGTPSPCNAPGLLGAYCNPALDATSICCPGAGCVDTASDSSNCGACGLGCPLGTSCSAGLCQ